MLERIERERITTLLKATICLLCKNGIAFKEKFTIDAVIGVTVDESDVILVSMNELIEAASSRDASDRKSPDVREDSVTEGQRLIQVKGRKRRRRHLSYDSEGNDSSDEDEDEDEDVLISASPGAAQSAMSLSNDNSQSSTDLVFVKHEMMDENWPSLETRANGASVSAERSPSDNSREQQWRLSAGYSSGAIAPLFIMDALGRTGTPSGEYSSKTVHNKRKRHRLPTLHQVITQRPRKTYSAAFKLEVIRFAEEHGGNRAAQRKYGVNEKCIRSWRKDKQRYAAEYEASVNSDVT